MLDLEFSVVVSFWTENQERDGVATGGGGYGAAAAKTAAVSPKTKNSTVGHP